MANKFNENDKVLCFHGPLIYEAKCLKFRANAKCDYEYYVHYAGWSKKWDEWVPQSRVLMYNETNLQTQKALQKNQAAEKKQKKATKRSSTGAGPDSATESIDPDSRPSTPLPEVRSKIKTEKNNAVLEIMDKKTKKLKLDTPIETESQFMNKVEVKIKVPDELKPWLVDDQILVVKKKKLANLPAKLTVEDILDKWVKSKKLNKVRSIASTTSAGILDYFNTMLASRLLYKEEREQYNQVTQERQGKLPSSYYGAVHLLRLFVRIGTVLAYTDLTEKALSLAQTAMNDFLRYMASNVSMYFSADNYS